MNSEGRGDDILKELGGQYLLYFDSGTSNSRAYLLDAEFEVRASARRAVGSRDSAIAGSSRVLIEALGELGDEVLERAGTGRESVAGIYASGMVTSPYGLREVPHLNLPLRFGELAESLYRFYEGSRFRRDIFLVPGLKTREDDFSLVNNVRGEEIEVVGALDELREAREIDSAVVLTPGSHTHGLYVRGDVIEGIVSNFTGELYYALKKETILAPVLSAACREPDGEMVRKGLENLERFGFNRALYLCHAMRIFERCTPQQRFSYGEAVIMGGVRKSLEYYLKNFWTDCHTLILVSDEFMYRLFSLLFEGSELIREVIWAPVSEGKSYGVRGLKTILSLRGGESHE